MRKTYYATEKSICSGRHLPESFAPPAPSRLPLPTHTPPPDHSNPPPPFRTPRPLLKNDHCASQLNEQRVTRKQDLASSFNWMRAPIPGAADAPAAESTDAITRV